MNYRPGVVPHYCCFRGPQGEVGYSIRIGTKERIIVDSRGVGQIFGEGRWEEYTTFRVYNTVAWWKKYV